MKLDKEPILMFGALLILNTSQLAALINIEIVYT